jgi:hypothetical protein
VPLPASANLCGIRYRVQTAEGMVVFAEESPVYGCQTRLTFVRRCGCWQVAIHNDTGSVSVCHLVAAHGVVCASFGGNFEQRNGEHEL